MIFYFTGTGNSLYAAQNVATKQGDKLISIAECLKNNTVDFTLRDDEKIGFVFPIYFWGLPTIVIDFISRLNFKNYIGQYLYTILVCGGNIGDSDNSIKRKLMKKNYHLNTVFTLVMPDNYILAFNLLTPENQIQAILKKTDEKLVEINEIISHQEKNTTKIDKKLLAKLQTLTSYPFYKYGRNTKPFFATDDCTGCGLCEQICPCQSIHLVNGKPSWSQKCTQCLGCLHRCPVHAIQYGKKTIPIGRYVNPLCKWE